MATSPCTLTGTEFPPPPQTLPERSSAYVVPREKHAVCWIILEPPSWPCVCVRVITGGVHAVGWTGRVRARPRHLLCFRTEHLDAPDRRSRTLRGCRPFLPRLPVRTPRLERDFGRLRLTSSASWAGFFGLVRSVRRGLVGTAALVASPVPARTLPRIAWAGRRVRQRIVRVGLRTWRRLTGVAHVNSPYGVSGCTPPARARSPISHM